MTTSQKTTFPSKPTGDEKVSLGTLSYLRTRNKGRVFNLIHNEFKRSGLSQKCLGARLGMDKGQLSRYLSVPGNWTLDMFSDFLFAISGAVPNYRANNIFDQPARNYTGPDWLTYTNDQDEVNIVGVESKPSSTRADLTLKHEHDEEPENYYPAENFKVVQIQQRAND